jgi:tRNA-Thr(GGU) m(6)t(6)A37 methyltransferase TsaA
VARTPFTEKAAAPRQPYAASGVAGTIELVAGRGFEHALEDLEGWERIWVLFWFHQSEGWRSKVLPPRSAKRRGLFSTRAPYRPNPIGLSVVRLETVRGLVLDVRDIDMLDGTPVLDIKPYVPIADAHPNARTGWLGTLAPEGDEPAIPGPADPEPGFLIAWDERARDEAKFLAEEHGVELAPSIERTLSLGPQPHPYRRIRRDGADLLLAIKEWRVRFRVEGRCVTVLSIASGYRPKELAAEPDGANDPLYAHRRFVARFGRS